MNQQPAPACHQLQSDHLRADLLEDHEQITKINSLSTNQMQKITTASRNRLSKKDSLDSETKRQSLDFDQQLNLDLLIEKLLETLTRTKIELMEIADEGLIIENEKTSEFKQFFLGEVKKYAKTLLLRQSQLGSLVYVIENKNASDFAAKYLATYSEIANFIIPVQHTSRQINTVILEQAFQTEIQFLKEYIDMIGLLKLNLVHKKYLTDMQSLLKNTSRLKIINSKIVTIAEVFPYACVMDRHDLFSYRRTHPRWHKLLETSVISYKIYGNKQAIKKSFEALKSGLNIVNATMSILHRTRQGWAGTAKDWSKDLGNLAESTSKIVKCLIWKQDATHQAEVLFSDPNDGLAKQIWNLPEQKMVRNLVNTILPGIAYSQEFWIPRLFADFPKDGPTGILPEVAIDNVDEYAKKLFEPSTYQQRLPMRINSPTTPKPRFSSGQKSYNLFGSLVKTFQSAKSLPAPTSVIYHIHGGGFISMSSYIHQTYTRTWANNLKVPIISVDYGKAPEYPFPHGLHDCLEGYMWTLYMYRQLYEVEPERVVLVGDSAGGNLVAALTNMLITLGLRVPDGIVLVYPALNLNYHNYTPSLLTSLNDMILPHTFLKICLNAYLKQQADSQHPYVSPLYASDEILLKYPPTRIFVGSKDPFHDDCCRLTERINKLRSNRVKLTIFDEFPHGFLQFDMKTQPHIQCRKATKQVQDALAELLLP